MKKLILFCIVLLLILVSCTPETENEAGEAPGGEDLPASAAPTGAPDYEAHTPENLKAVWMSQWDLQRVYLKGEQQREETDFRIRAKAIMENAVLDGFNTVFLQVRPFGDSFYPSAYYPPSKMVVGAYGREFAYDPVAILADAAHTAGLSVHAWINPLRLMTTEEIEQIPADYPVRRWYDDPALRGTYLVLQGDGRWYLNPGYTEVCDLIVAGAREAMEKYAFDGLHMDDYFYPTTSVEYDAQCFAEYTAAGGEMDLGDFRRDCVTALVCRLYEAVHEVREGALFGIAPGGNADRAFASQYADVYTWCAEEGCVDYICPEIYFGFEHETYPFDKTAEKWSQMVVSSSVRLLIGLSFHKASSGFDQYAGSGAYEWAQHTDILYRSLEYAAGIKNCSGVAVFSYQYFRNALTGDVPDYPKDEREAFLPLVKKVVFPASAGKTTEEGA